MYAFHDSCLTELEINILQLLAEGSSKTRIEHRLSISRATIYRQLESTRTKLRAETNTHAVTIAINQGLITPKPAQLQTAKDVQSQKETPNSSSPCWRTLTRREREIFLLLGDVKTSQETDKQLARQLNIAEGTFKKHLHRIYKKLGVANRAGAAILAATVKQKEDNSVTQYPYDQN